MAYRKPSLSARLLAIVLIVLIVIVEGMNLSVYRTTEKSADRVDNAGTLLANLATLQRHGFVWASLYHRTDQTEIRTDIQNRRRDFGELQERLIADPSTDDEVRNDLLAIQYLLPEIDELDEQLASQSGDEAAATTFSLSTALDQLSLRTSRLYDREHTRYGLEIARISEASRDSQKNLLIASGTSGVMGLALLIIFWRQARSDLRRAYIRIVAESREREVAEQALRESETRYRSVLANVNEVVFECDPEGRWTFLTSAWTELTEFTVEESLGLHFMEFVRASDREQLQQQVALLVEERKRSDDAGINILRRLETCFVTKSGKARQIEIRYSVILGPDQEPSLILGTLHDVTDRQKLEFQLRQAQKLEAVGSLAAGMAHEINTPIQFINDNLRFLRDAFQTLTDEDVIGLGADDTARTPGRRDEIEFLRAEVPEALDQAIGGVDRVATIVKAMKAFAHPDVIVRQMADLNQALRDTVVVAQSEYRDVADVIFELEEIPPVWCRVGEINQVFLNLLVNSAHAIADVAKDGKRGTITIASAAVGDNVVITFSDTGSGIPDDIIQRIFDPFFTTKTVGKGTGQGLSIAHAIAVDNHNGSIDVISEVGKGTTFRIQLPISMPSDFSGNPESR